MRACNRQIKPASLNIYVTEILGPYRLSDPLDYIVTSKETSVTFEFQTFFITPYELMRDL